MEKCCGEWLVEKCCRQVLWGSVVGTCCERVLWRMACREVL